jgi:hypothetical protein
VPVRGTRGAERDRVCKGARRGSRTSFYRERRRRGGDVRVAMAINGHGAG